MEWKLLPLALVLAALPPQSDEELKAEADRVVVGEVTAVYQREVKVSGGVDHEFVALVTPAAGAGDSAQKSLYVHFRQTAKRPRGWAGPAGQDSPLRPSKKKVRLYLDQRADGQLWLLEPNGWAPAGD